MKKNDSFSLTEIAGVPYLLPFGQMIADQKRGIRLNETGIFLWKLLEQERSLDELIRLCATSYEVTAADELQELSADISAFVSDLARRGIVTNKENTAFQLPCEKTLCIGGLNIKLSGPAEVFSPGFDPYCTDSCDKIHMSIEILYGSPRIKQNGTILLRNEEFVVIDNADEYILLFPMTPQLREAHLSKDASCAQFYCIPPYTDEFRENLFHAIRMVYLYLAQKHNMMVIHSASLLYQGKAWLFSGPSGTGKSTHTNLWNQLFDTPILNGDLNLLSIGNGQPVIHGLPWCGTSGISDTGTYPLGGITILKKAPGDTVEELSADRKQLSVMNRFISPCWNRDMLAQNLSFAQSLAEHILICRLHCTKEDSAAYTMKDYIDSYIKK